MKNYDFFYFTLKRVKHNSRNVPFAITELGHRTCLEPAATLKYEIFFSAASLYSVFES